MFGVSQLRLWFRIAQYEQLTLEGREARKREEALRLLRSARARV